MINTYVHDGSRMFVGAGRPTHSWSMAVRLRPVNDTPERLTPSEIYRAVVNEVLTLRGADGLMPGQRLAGLTHGAVALTSAQALIAHADEPLAAVDHALRAHGLSTDEFTEQSMAVLAATLIRPVE